MEQHPLGCIQVGGHSIHPIQEDNTESEGASITSGYYAFTLVKGGTPSLTLAAHTPLTRHQWAQVLTQASAHAAQRDEVVETCGLRLQHGPASVSTPDCFGYLHKLGARYHQWKRRYCVLKDAALYLYHDTEATQAIGVVQLQGYRVQSTSLGGKKHAFELLPPEPRFRHFYFYTETDSDKEEVINFLRLIKEPCDKTRWLAALEYSIDRWIKVV
ncbi:hypothetical protein Pcinc_039164 [Petrolisthes cinctipes]|uniref:PH domain-containing protein n=1 Tax=Petrolisthes cinctipes TaxID=88211 RepID=A0AAE1BPE3_PETCI|nr:hypothetical protein Pcinc_039164 [Petrolisthes cinctipes]